MNDPNLWPVGCYGLHATEDGVNYLHQGAFAANFIGLKKPSPHVVRLRVRKACPHMINVLSPRPDRVHWESFLKIMNDELVQEMLPLPKKPHGLVPFLGDEFGRLSKVLISLSRMCSPNYSVISTMSSTQWYERTLSDLSITNVAPLIINGCGTRHQDKIIQLAGDSLHLPRKLILVGHPDMICRAPLRRITTELTTAIEDELMLLPLEAIGANILKKYARNEPLDSVMEKRA